MALAAGQWADLQGNDGGGLFVNGWMRITGVGFRQWWISGLTTHDYPSGTQVTFTVNQNTSGVVPTQPTALTCEIYPDDQGSAGTGALATIALSPSAATQTVSVWLSSTPGASGGVPQVGLLRLNLHATDGTGATNYNVDSDGYRTTLGTDLTAVGINQPLLRSDDTLTAGLSAVSGGTKPALFSYGDAVWSHLAVGAAPNVAAHYPITQTLGAIFTSTVNAALTVDTNMGAVANNFPASSGAQTLTATVGNAGMKLANTTAIPWMNTAPAADSDTFDPRLTITRLLQLNDNTFGTPPLTKNAGSQRLTSDLGFITARFTNAAGVGLNGLTYNATIRDQGLLVAGASRSGVLTTVEGGQDGWGAGFLTWPDALPGGVWVATTTITAPAGATGLESPPTDNYRLVASDPNLRMITAGGPATPATDTKHLTPGAPFLAGLAVFNTLTNKTMALDATPVPAIAIGRFNLTAGRAEFLAADLTWQPTLGATVYYWPCAQSPGDSHVWTVTFADTSTWGVADVFTIGHGYIGGVPLSAFQKEIVVSGINNHNQYSFDGPGFIGLPTR